MGRRNRQKPETFEEYVARPRTTCCEIAPEIGRLEKLRRGKKEKLFHMQSMMKKARIKHVPDLMKHVSLFLHLIIMFGNIIYSLVDRC